MKFRIDGEVYKNLVFVTDGDLAVCLQAGLQMGGYKSELIEAEVRGKTGWRVLIGDHWIVGL